MLFATIRQTHHEGVCFGFELRGPIATRAFGPY
jgi:hypothetical protein